MDDSQQKVHRIVARVFIGPCPPGYQVNHKNGDKNDARLENLEYCTPKENSRHARESLGHNFQGESVGTAKLTEAQVREIRRLHDIAGISSYRLARMYGMGTSQILRIIHRQSWTHI